MLYQDEISLEQLYFKLKNELKKENLANLEKFANDYHPEDIAKCLIELSEQDSLKFIVHLEEKTAGLIISHINSEYRADLLEKMDQNKLSEIVEEMSSDDATDIVSELDKKVATGLLSLSDEGSFKHISSLLKYPEDTAGGIMDPDFIWVKEDITCDETIQLIRDNVTYFKDVNTIFVSNKDREFVGFIKLSALIAAQPSSIIKNLMSTDIIAVDVNTDQAEVAEVVKKYDLTTLPVVDYHHHLMGIITIDDVVDIIEEENEEDALKMAAISQNESSKSVLKTAFYRMPWLLTCLVGTVLSGGVISLFESTLSSVLVLASFIPAIMGMGGNSGIQTSTLTIRNLVAGVSLKKSKRHLIFQEVRVAAMIGLMCGSLAGIMAHLFFQKGYFGIVVGISMFFSILVSACMGIMLPFVFERLSIDPAVASGPIITTMNDILALIIYLGLATCFIDMLT